MGNQPSAIINLQPLLCYYIKWVKAMMDSGAATTLTWWRRILLGVCALLLMVVSIPAQAAIPAESLLFEPQPYLEALERSGFYEDYPRVAFDLATAGGDLVLPGLAQFVEKLFQPDRYESVMRFIFPEYWVRRQMEQMVTQFWAYNNFETREMRLVLDFRPVKARLEGEDGRALISGAFQNLPECSAQDLLSMAALALQGRTDEMPQCKPPRQLEGLVFGGLQQMLEGFTGTLPDELVLMQRESPKPEMLGPGGLYRFLRYGLRYSLLMVVMLLAAGALLLGYERARLIEWAGTPFYLGGLLGAVLCALAGVFARWLSEAIAGILQGTARLTFEFFSGVFLDVFQQFLAWAGVAGAIWALIGLVLILVSRRRA